MRTTNDPKTSRIELRLNDETRAFVEREAQKRGQTISKYIRELLSDYAKSVHTTSESVYTENESVYTKLVEDIVNTIELQGEDVEVFLKTLNDKLNNYEITFKDGEIRIGE